MLEFGDIFASATAMSAYMIGSVIGIAANGLFVMRLALKHDTNARPEAQRAMRLKVAAAVAMAALFLVTGVGARVSTIASHRQAAAVSAQPATISIDEIQRRIDVNALPVQDVSDYM